MSNKEHAKLWEADKFMSGFLPPSMLDQHQGTRVTLEYLNGFELFNTRPYHNYETRSTGWRVTGEGQTIEREDLDDAVKAWAEKVNEAKIAAAHATADD